MGKLPKFLISKNELATDRVFITHTGKYTFLAEVFEFEKHNDRTLLIDEYYRKYNSNFLYAQTEVNNLFVLIVVIKMFEEIDITENYAKLKLLMFRMGDWYKNYKKKTINKLNLIKYNINRFIPKKIVR